ncbi:MAG: hypothetical protein ACOCYD_02420 [bacterium]
MENINQKSAEMESFVSRLKKQDDYNLRLGKVLKRFYIIMVVFFVLLMVVNPFSDFDPYHRINGVLFALAFSWFAFLFEKLQKDFRHVNYGLPTREMMQKVVKRYRITAGNYLMLFPPLVLVDIALSLSAYHHGDAANPWMNVWMVQLMFGLVISVAVFAGYQVWRIKQKPLIDYAREMLKELDQM